MNNWLKHNGTHLAIIAIFLGLCFMYFAPALQGKSLIQQDVQQAQAMQKEIMNYKEKDGKAPLWTNSMFGGMPAYQIWVQYPNNVTTYVVSFFKTVFPNPIDVVLLYLLGAYLLFCVLRINPWLAAAGAIAFAFSSYHFIIIEAGHGNKAMAIAFFAPIVAGIILTLRGKYLLGAVLTALFLSLEIRANHIQMTYYLFVALLIFMGIELAQAIRSKQLRSFNKSFVYLLCAAALAIAVNASMLWTTYEYGQESLRGKSNLSSNKAVPAAGLDRDYAYQWSQGVKESITFLIPNAYGGASVTPADESSEVVKLLKEQGVSADQATGFASQLPSYWGAKPGTSGPWYFGAIVCLLFVLGLFVVRDRIKWWIVGATLLSLFLSFGKNFPLVSDLFFDYFPLYNKFRAVESTLVIAALLIPILAVLAVKELTESKEDAQKQIKKLLYALYISGGAALLLALMPTLFLSFKAANHQDLVKQLMRVVGDDRSFADKIAAALVQDRVAMARMDAIRSLVFILLGAGLLWALIKKKLGAQAVYISLALFILIDLWGVDRRYLNNESFVEKEVLNQQFQPREVDQAILRDTSLDYRVLDLSIPTFSSASTSFFHKTVGGYHAAKLKRVQELLDRQFNSAINEDVLDMLNTKYAIYNDQKAQMVKVQPRPSACGNAWIVQDVHFVKNAEEEMKAIDSFDPKKTAYVDERFKSLIPRSKVGFDENASIKLVDYHPDHLSYQYTAAKDVVAVFSEIWYDKGWNAYLDGTKIPYFRADYVLRAAALPAGNHKVEFKFEPRSYELGEIISLIASILLVGAIGFVIYRRYAIKVSL